MATISFVLFKMLSMPNGRRQKKKGKRKKHIVGGGKEKVAGEGQQVLDLDTAKAREEETGGKPQEDKYAIVWLVPM